MTEIPYEAISDALFDSILPEMTGAYIMTYLQQTKAQILKDASK